MIILDGNKASNDLLTKIIPRISFLKEKNIIPSIAVILANHSTESMTYIQMKKKACEKIGINFTLYNYYQSNESDILLLIKKLNESINYHAILVQLPLPEGFNKNKILSSIDPNKDIDGLHPLNLGKLFQNNNINFIPCTPRGCMDLLDYYKINVKSKNIVIVGSSCLVGLPLSICLLYRGATVTLCNIDTIDIKQHTMNADIVIACCGVPELIKGDWIKQDSIIIDIGINKISDSSKKGYKLVGDVDFNSVKDKVTHITPVPGGVGPMTIYALIKQIIETCERKFID
tara:strand:- start:191 stop:1054 length:864 start_codon:yes stop_codon:yes gene_type:complete